jgi:hypothetical protein
MRLPPMIMKPSNALIRVWHVDISFAKGPTLSSLLGIVKLKGFPSVDMNAISIVAGKDDIFEHAIPYAPGSSELALMSGEIIE